MLNVNDKERRTSDTTDEKYNYKQHSKSHYNTYKTFTLLLQSKNQ